MTDDIHRFDDHSLPSDDFGLRAPCASDIDAITQACRDALTQKWLPLPNPYRWADAQRYVEEFAPSQLASGNGIVRVIEVDGEVAGVIDLKKTDWRAATTEIGYWVAPAYRGKGLAGRASALLADWALREQGMQRVEIRAAVGNIGSARAAKAAGFGYEGCLRSAGFTHAGRVDLEVYGRTVEDLARREA
ncbi:GNAT family N-acetyltransferase [Leekyejoonella antrihumi]|uniref:GNAT family N-acetyltransferase n=1 Tax=Leekyejoonella antrihumi TaxID=1660198 RepID=A0A563DVR1_9MICO|nr:GNAT family N-acetyltransferase [Leekyejoonella antrihumi]TWP34032.1 GNAT family N-acetyltransferase [Leekyejoonella antrihumi]